MNEFQMVAKTFQGLEEVLAKELTELGANDIQIGRRMVSFTGDKAMLYKTNFCLHTAVRILKPIKIFKAVTADEVYDEVKMVEWEKYMDNSTSFAVDAVVYSDDFRHSKFVAYRVKDAIADYFREKTMDRPSVQINNPDLMLHIHISQDQCTLAIDSSGESLHRRGYRQETGDAPINEVLAAGMIMLSGWHGECDFIDPMCGSGTLIVEAALIARNIAPGIFRKGYAFEKWKDFDKELLDSIYEDDSKEREFDHKIYGYDNDAMVLKKAILNVRAASAGKDVELAVRDIKDFVQPAEKSLLMTNPPYGERISSDNLLELYRTLGERLKHAFQGNEAWVIGFRPECIEKIGLKPSVVIPLFNGALPCEFRKYELFGGGYRDFRKEGESLNKEDVLYHGKPRTSLRRRSSEGEGDNEPPRRRSFGADGDRPVRRRSSEGGGDNERPRRRSFGADGDRPVRRRSSEGSGDNEHPRRRSFGNDGDRPVRRRSSEGGGESERPRRRSFGNDGDRPVRRRSSEGGGDNERPRRRSFGADGDRPVRRRSSEGGGNNERPRRRSFGADGDRPVRRRNSEGTGRTGKPSFGRERRGGEAKRSTRREGGNKDYKKGKE